MSLRLLGKTLTAALCGTVFLWCQAHEGPEHEIEELTEQMRVQGDSPALLLRRAVEYRVLGKMTEAAKDLERTLDLDETSVSAQRELSQAYFSLGKTNEALSLVTRAIKSPADPVEKASLLMVRAGILRARGEYRKALNDVNEAIGQYNDNVEWYLIRSQLQAVLNLKRERVEGIEAGLRATGSGLLLAESVDALIDDGRYAVAAEHIQTELQAARWKSSWLIRRAKVRLATGNAQDGRADLLAAMDELNQRLSSSAADALLLADRALANDLLGNKEQARSDYRAARDKGLTDEWVRERIRALRDSAKEDN